MRWYRRSEEHTSELQSHVNLVCRLLLEKKHAGVVLRASMQGKVDTARPRALANPDVEAYVLAIAQFRARSLRFRACLLGFSIDRRRPACFSPLALHAALPI